MSGAFRMWDMEAVDSIVLRMVFKGKAVKEVKEVTNIVSITGWSRHYSLYTFCSLLCCTWPRTGGCRTRYDICLRFSGFYGVLPRLQLQG